MRSTLTALGLGLVAAAGCATGITAYEVEPGSDEPGLRYYLPTPLLVVRQLGDGRWAASLELVVDRRREFTVQPWAFLARASTTVEFAPDGTLKRFQLEQDSTEVPAAVVNAFKDIKTKELEIREKLMRERQRHVESSAARMADALAQPRPAITRAVYAAVVRGGLLEDWDGRPIASVRLPPAKPARTRYFPVDALPAAGALTVQIHGTRLVVSVRDGSLAAQDIGRMRFWTASDEITESALLRRLRAALTEKDGTLVGDVAQLRAAAIVRLGFGARLRADLR